MMGDKTAAGGGKVLRSTIEDNVFVFFVDHGAPGILAFPGLDDKHPFSFFYADQLMDTFEYMYTHRMYKEMVFYAEACEAGSMFIDLPDDMNIYTMTASDESVSSWAIYCDEEAIIEGKDIPCEQSQVVHSLVACVRGHNDHPLQPHGRIREHFPDIVPRKAIAALVA